METTRRWTRPEALIGHLVGGIGHGIAYAILAAAAALAVYLWRILNTADVQTLRYSAVAAAAVAVAASLVALFYQRRYSRKKKSLKKVKELNEQSEKNDDCFGSLAQANAESDRDLFDLFLYEIAPKELPQEATRKSLVIIRHNIEKILDHTAQVFERITNDRCAVCVKIIDVEENGHKTSNLRARTFMRDTHSRGQRYQHDKRRELVQNNAADKHIFTPADGYSVNEIYFPNEIYACDDLVAAEATNKYFNDRPNWAQDYNATIVAAVHNLRPKVPIPFVGLLCVDNLKGGLDTPKARQYITQISWRLSVMLYRMDLLQGCLSEKSSNPSLTDNSSRSSGHLGYDATGDSAGAS